MKKIGGFDLLKIISATLIVFHHYQQVFQVSFEYINFCGGRIIFGFLVELFFIISGFLISFTPPPSERWSIWWRRKLLRLYPMTAVACLSAIIINSIGAGADMAVDGLGNLVPLNTIWNVKTLAANFLLIFSGWPYFSMLGINNPTWYCCVLIQCYIVFFILMKLTERFSDDPEKIQRYLFIIIALSSYFFCRLGIIQGSTFRGLEAFFIGGFLCRIYRRIIMNRNMILILSLLLLVSLIAALLIPSQQRRILLFGMFPPLILLSTRIDFRARLHEFAQVSFEVFIWHAPLIFFEKMIIRIFEIPNFERTYTSMIIFTAGVWLFSWIMYNFIEMPINKFLSQKQR